MKLILFTSRLPLGKCPLLVTNNIHGNINTVNFFYTKLTLYYFFMYLLLYFRLSEVPLVSAWRQWLVRTGTFKNLLVSAPRLNWLMPVLTTGVTSILMT